jgi:hypothetical protein
MQRGTIALIALPLAGLTLGSRLVPGALSCVGKPRFSFCIGAWATAL